MVKKFIINFLTEDMCGMELVMFNHKLTKHKNLKNLYISLSSKNLIVKGNIGKVNSLYLLLVLILYMSVLLIRIHYIFVFIILITLISTYTLNKRFSYKLALGFILSKVNNVEFNYKTNKIFPIYIYSYKRVIYVDRCEPPKGSKYIRSYIVSPLGLYYAIYDYIVTDELSLNKLKNKILFKI